MRSMWSGALSFGLINIPVKLYSATIDHAISFDMLHKKDFSPIRYAKICKEEDKEVPYQDIVKGYEYQKGEYVVLTEEDFKRANLRKTGTIEIMAFTNKEEIDSMFFEKPYYLEPSKGADKAYALLREALRKANKVGIVKFVFSHKEHLGIIQPHGDALILNQMRFANEIRKMDELRLPSGKEINKKEIDMALKLVDQLSDHFRPEEFHDEYTKELEEVIAEKLKGEVPRQKGAVPKPSKVQDIMSLLKASLEEKAKPAKRPTKPKARKRA